MFWALGVPDCNLYEDTIQANAQTEEFYGNLDISIENLPYPLREVNAGNIIIKLYDGLNYKLLARTYANLSPTRFNFVYPGPLIVINNDSPIAISSGSMSGFIPVTLSYPCALNLTLIPLSKDFTFLPYQIPLQVGDTFQEFRISIPSNTKNNTYFITWTTLGEIEPAYYVSIIPTTIYVSNDPVVISIETPTPIPVGGRSLPIIIFFTNAPDCDLTVTLALPSTSSGIYLSESALVYNNGIYSKNFTIQVSKDCTAVRGNVLIGITGTNIDSFTLPFTSLPFDIFTDKDTPEVLSLELLGISKTTAQFSITANKICGCYYAYAYEGTDTPSFAEVFSQGPPPYYSTNTKYGYTRIIEYKQGLISLTNLIKETQYSLYI